MSRVVPLLLVLAGCARTEGGLVSFAAVARGDGESSFTTAAGWQVQLTQAKVFVGALYLNQSNPGAQTLETSCVLPGIYSGEVRGSVTIDALSTADQPFAAEGRGTQNVSSAAELWLSSGDVDASEDRTVLLALEGTAAKNGPPRPFRASLHIGKNRVTPPNNPALPGANPLCKQRIVSPLRTDFTLEEGGTVELVVRPRGFLESVDFDTADPDGQGGLVIPDENRTQAGIATYQALRATQGPWAVQWRAP